jgi:hypothetical protein
LFDDWHGDWKFPHWALVYLVFGQRVMSLLFKGHYLLISLRVHTDLIIVSVDVWAEWRVGVGVLCEEIYLNSKNRGISRPQADFFKLPIWEGSGDTLS